MGIKQEKHRDTKYTADYQRRAAAADNTPSQKQHTVAKYNTQHTTAGKTTPGTPLTAHTQDTGSDNKARHAIAAQWVDQACQHHAWQRTRIGNQT